MRIALLGTRGIPAAYGGFETFAEELSVRLVQRGHKVTVYCRQEYREIYRGVRLRYLPAIRHKYFETVSHTFLSTLDLSFRRFDVVLYCNAANAVFTLWPRVLRLPVALNVDGLERRRKKWNRLGKGWYAISERLATWCPRAIVTDSEKIREYYFSHYQANSTFIPYGAAVGEVNGTQQLEALGLEPRKYVLYVSRMEPENNALMVRQAFEKVKTEMRLVLVGDAPYAADYIRRVRDTTDERIIIPGAIYGEGYHQLQSHAWAYVQATEVGGTHPALIEAMGRGSLVLYLKTPESTEVAGGVAVEFENDLPEKLKWAVDVSDEERAEWGRRAMQRVAERYSWDAVTDAYEKLFRELSHK